MNLLVKLEGWIFKSPLWALCLCLFIVFFIKTGFWYIPNLELSFQIAQNPFKNPFSDPNAHYLMTTWLSPYLAWLFGIKTWFRFFLFHFFICLLFSLIYLAVVFHRYTNEQARIALIALIIFPVMGSIYYWIGPDALTVLLILLIFCSSSKPWLAFGIAILLGMQHFEQGVLAATMLLLGAILNHASKNKNTFSIYFYIAFFLGVIAGKALQIEIFQALGIIINSGRAYVLEKHFTNIATQFALNFQFIVWSTMGLGWLVAFFYINLHPKAWGFYLNLLLPLFLLPLVADETRVLSIIYFPLVLNYFLLNPHFLNNISRTQASFVFLLWLILPWGWALSGAVEVSVFPYTVMNIAHKFLGWFDVPAYHDYWPFH